MTVSAKGDPSNAKSIYEFTANNIDGEEVVTFDLDRLSKFSLPGFP